MPSTPQQIVRRERVESVIRLASPLLDVVLKVGERVSRVAGREDEHYPIRSADDFELPAPRPAERRGRERVGTPPDA